MDGATASASQARGRNIWTSYSAKYTYGSIWSCIRGICGDMLLAGLVPGLFLGVIVTAVVVWQCIKKGYKGVGHLV